MKKKQILIVTLIGVIGFIAGCFTVIGFFGQFNKNIGQVSGLHYRADWEKRAFQAYSEEDPQVGVWALTNLADILTNQEDIAESDEKKLIQKDIVLTYTRLAIASRKMEEGKKYQEYISKALALAKMAYSDEPTEEHLLSFVEKLDQIGKKKTNQ